MTVAQPRPELVIVVAAQMRQAHDWARRHDIPFGSTVFAKADGDTRSLTVLRGLRGLPYVALVEPNEFTRTELEIGEHYRVGGS